MNGFTKEELDYIADILKVHIDDYPTLTTRDSDFLDKIQYMIDNYSSCDQYPSHIERDRTPMQCDCYTRGQDDEFKMMVAAIHDILDGKDDGTGANYETWGALRRRLLDLVRRVLNDN